MIWCSNKSYNSPAHIWFGFSQTVLLIISMLLIVDVFVVLFATFFTLRSILFSIVSFGAAINNNNNSNSDNTENLQKVKWNQVRREQNLVDSSAIFIDKRDVLCLYLSPSLFQRKYKLFIKNCLCRMWVDEEDKKLRKKSTSMRENIHEQCENVQPTAFVAHFKKFEITRSQWANFSYHWKLNGKQQQVRMS